LRSPPAPLDNYLTQYFNPRIETSDCALFLSDLGILSSFFGRVKLSLIVSFLIA